MESQEGERQEFIQLDPHYERTTGPIPPPGMLRGYEEVLPGSADRILTMAEQEQERQIKYDNLGLLFGFIAALALIVLSAYIVSLGFAWQSVGVVIGSIAGTAGTFIYSNRRRAERNCAIGAPPCSSHPQRPNCPIARSNPTANPLCALCVSVVKYAHAPKNWRRSCRRSPHRP